MKLGISTACFYPLPIEQALDEIGKLGLRTAEIFFNTESENRAPCEGKRPGNLLDSSVHLGE